MQVLRSKGRGRGGSPVKDNMRLDKSVTNNDLGPWKARKVSDDLAQVVVTSRALISSNIRLLLYSCQDILIVFLFSRPNNLARDL